MKNNFFQKFKLSKNQKYTAGFTLIELLVAMSLTLIVISGAGLGLVTIMNANAKGEIEGQRQSEFNRALDFIADEIRTANSIATDASANLSTLAPNFTSTSKTPVLTLQIPGVPQRVIYYITATNSPWLGPMVIYRWGPNFVADGSYSSSTLTTPSAWTYEPLVDLIEDSTPNPNTSCSSTYTNSNPTVSNRTGFYSCVNSDGNSAEIYLRGRITDAYGGLKTSYDVNRKVFARSALP